MKQNEKLRQIKAQGNLLILLKIEIRKKTCPISASSLVLKFLLYVHLCSKFMIRINIMIRFKNNKILSTLAREV